MRERLRVAVEPDQAQASEAARAGPRCGRRGRGWRRRRPRRARRARGSEQGDDPVEQDRNVLEARASVSAAEPPVSRSSNRGEHAHGGRGRRRAVKADCARLVAGARRRVARRRHRSSRSPAAGVSISTLRCDSRAACVVLRAGGFEPSYRQVSNRSSGAALAPGKGRQDARSGWRPRHRRRALVGRSERPGSTSSDRSANAVSCAAR